jgi:hypothetical protein
MKNKITFYSKRKQNIGNEHVPTPSKNSIPEWFLSADKHKKMPNGVYELSYAIKNGYETFEKIPSWKSCPALLDAVVSGYTLKTPVDIYISKEDNQPVITNIEECNYFCGTRGKQDGFPTPDGYEDLQLNWIVNWMPKVPEGYTTLWTHPLNRFDLPFISVSGFIDTQSYVQKGKLPFFIKKDFEGVIPAGTTFIQVIPFKNEGWEMDLKTYTEEEIKNNDKVDLQTNYTDYKSNYKELFWRKKQHD